MKGNLIKGAQSSLEYKIGLICFAEFILLYNAD